MTESILAQEHALFPIRELSARTKVNTVTIRAWERRYGLLKPKRTAKGHRLYSEADVQQIEQVLALMARGVPVSKVKALLQQDVPEELTDDSDTWQGPVAQLIESAVLMSSTRFETQLRDNFMNYPAALCREHLIEPIMDALQKAADNPAGYHFAQSEILRYALSRLAAPGKRSKGLSFMLVCGNGTPIWPLALAAIELTDANCNVQLINQPCDVDGCLALANVSKADHCLIYQDGVWREDEITLIKTTLPSIKRLVLCGTAPMLAGFKASARFIPGPRKFVEQFIADAPDK